MTQQTDDNKMKSTQTAVEWLFQKMTEQGTNPYWDMRFIQAKQMEKEQIMNAYNKGNMESEIANLYAEKFYKETYNK